MKFYRSWNIDKHRFTWGRKPGIRINDWLEGNVVAISKVPRKVRNEYRDTLTRAALAARMYGKKVHVNSSYRDPALQALMYAQNMDKATGRPKPGRPLTAKPGTSPHERGIGLDIPNARITTQLINKLRIFELVDDVSSEIWHVTNHAALRRGA